MKIRTLSQIVRESGFKRQLLRAKKFFTVKQPDTTVKVSDNGS